MGKKTWIKQLAFANQQVMCERFPENKRALACAAFALVFTVHGGTVGTVGMGCPDIRIRKKNKTSGDCQRGEYEAYGPIPFHFDFKRLTKVYNILLQGVKKLAISSNR
jgi:hypothetical protein